MIDMPVIDCHVWGHVYEHHKVNVCVNF
jgi:hypothetical protein